MFNLRPFRFALTASLVVLAGLFSQQASAGSASVPLYITGKQFSGNALNTSSDDPYTSEGARQMIYDADTDCYRCTFTAGADNSFSMSTKTDSYAIWNQNGVVIDRQLYGKNLSDLYDVNRAYLLNHDKEHGEGGRAFNLVSGQTYTIIVKCDFVSSLSATGYDTDYNDYIICVPGTWQDDNVKEAERTKLYIAGTVVDKTITSMGNSLSETNEPKTYALPNVREFAWSEDDNCYYYAFKASDTGATSTSSTIRFSLSRFAHPQDATAYANFRSHDVTSKITTKTLSSFEKAADRLYYKAWNMSGKVFGSTGATIAPGETKTLNEYEGTRYLTGLDVTKSYRLKVPANFATVTLEELPSTTDLYITGPAVNNSLTLGSSYPSSYSSSVAAKMTKSQVYSHSHYITVFHYTFTADGNDAFSLSRAVSDSPNYNYWDTHGLRTDVNTMGTTLKQQVLYSLTSEEATRTPSDLTSGETYTIYVSDDYSYMWIMPGAFNQYYTDVKDALLLRPDETGNAAAMAKPFAGLASEKFAASKTADKFLTAIIFADPTTGLYSYRVTENISLNNDVTGTADEGKRNPYFMLSHGDPEFASFRYTTTHCTYRDPLSADNTRYEFYRDDTYADSNSESIKTAATDVTLYFDLTNHWMWITDNYNPVMYAKVNGGDAQQMAKSGDVYTLAVPDGTDAMSYQLSLYNDEGYTGSNGFASGQLQFANSSLGLGGSTGSGSYSTVSVTMPRWGAQLTYNPATGRLSLTGSDSPVLYITGPLVGHGVDNTTTDGNPYQGFTQANSEQMSLNSAKTYFYYEFVYDPDAALATPSGITNKAKRYDFAISTKADNTSWTTWDANGLVPLNISGDRTGNTESIHVGVVYNLGQNWGCTRPLSHAAADASSTDLVKGRSYTFVVASDYSKMWVAEGTWADVEASLDKPAFYINGAINNLGGALYNVSGHLQPITALPARMSYDSATGTYFYNLFSKNTLKVKNDTEETAGRFAIFEDDPTCSEASLWSAENHITSDKLKADATKYAYVADETKGYQQLDESNYSGITLYFKPSATDPKKGVLWAEKASYERAPLHLNIPGATLKPREVGDEDVDEDVYIFQLADCPNASTPFELKIGYYGNDGDVNTAFGDDNKLLRFDSSTLNFNMIERVMSIPGTSTADQTRYYDYLQLPTTYYSALVEVRLNRSTGLGRVILTGSVAPEEVPLYIMGHFTNNHPVIKGDYHYLAYRNVVSQGLGAEGTYSAYTKPWDIDKGYYSGLRRMNYGPVIDGVTGEVVTDAGGNTLYEYTYTMAGGKFSTFEISTGCDYASQETAGNRYYNGSYKTWTNGMVIYDPDKTEERSQPKVMATTPFNKPYAERTHFKVGRRRDPDGRNRDMMINEFNSDYIYTIHVSSDLTDMYITEQPVNMPLKAADFFEPYRESDYSYDDRRPRSHYFVVGTRTADWRLLPEWELKVDENGVPKLAGRFMYDGYMAIAKVDTYLDYVRHNYWLYSNADPTNPDDQIYTGTDAGGNANPDIDLKRMGDTSNGPTKSGALLYTDHDYTHNFTNSITWNFDRNISGHGEYVNENGEPSTTMMRYSLPYYITDMHLTLDPYTAVNGRNGEPIKLTSEGTADRATVLANRTFSFVGSDINYETPFDFDAALSLEPGTIGTRDIREMTPSYQSGRTGVLDGPTEKNWANSWVSYDENGTPYFDANRQLLPLTAYDREWLSAHPIEFDMDLGEEGGEMFHYMSDNLVFEKWNQLDNLDTDPYRWLYTQHPGYRSGDYGRTGGFTIGKIDYPEEIKKIVHEDGTVEYPTLGEYGYSRVEDSDNLSTDYRYQERLVNEDYANATAWNDPINKGAYNPADRAQNYSPTAHDGTYTSKPDYDGSVMVDNTGWVCYVVRDVWLRGNFNVWTGWGGNLASAEGTFEQPAYDTANRTLNDMRWYFGNFGHSKPNSNYEVTGHDVLVTAKQEDFGDKPRMLYKTYRDVDNAVFRTEGAQVDPTTGEATGPAVHFDRVLLWYDTKNNPNAASAPNGVLQFIREDLGPQAKAYHQPGSSNKLYVRWNIADFTDTHDKAAWEVTSYEITRWHYVNGVPELYRKFPAIEPEDVMTVGSITAGKAGATTVRFDDPYQLPAGDYYYTVTVHIQNPADPSQTASKTAVTNELTISAANKLVTVKAEQEMEGTKYSFNVHVDSKLAVNESFLNQISHYGANAANYTVGEDAGLFTLTVDEPTMQLLSQATKVEIVNPAAMVKWTSQTGNDSYITAAHDCASVPFTKSLDFVGFGLNKACLPTGTNWSDVVASQGDADRVEVPVKWHRVSEPYVINPTCNNPSTLTIVGNVSGQTTVDRDANYRGVYHFSVDITDSGDGYGYFKFTDGSTSYNAISENTLAEPGDLYTDYWVYGDNDHNAFLWKAKPGTYELTVDFNQTPARLIVAHEPFYQLRFDIQQYYARYYYEVDSNTGDIINKDPSRFRSLHHIMKNKDLTKLKFPEIVFHNVQPTDNIANDTKAPYEFNAHLGPEDDLMVTIDVGEVSDGQGGFVNKTVDKSLERVWLENFGFKDDQASTDVYLPPTVLTFEATVQKSNATTDYTGVDYANTDHMANMPSGSIGMKYAKVHVANPVHYTAVNEIVGEMHTAMPVTDEVLNNVAIGYENVTVTEKGQRSVTSDALETPVKRVAGSNPTADVAAALSYLPAPATESTSVAVGSSEHASDFSYATLPSKADYTAQVRPVLVSEKWGGESVRQRNTSKATSSVSLAALTPTFSIVATNPADKGIFLSANDGRSFGDPEVRARAIFALKADNEAYKQYNAYFAFNVTTPPDLSHDSKLIQERFGEAYKSGRPVYMPVVPEGESKDQVYAAHWSNLWNAGQQNWWISPMENYTNFDHYSATPADYNDAVHNWSRIAAEANYLPILFEPVAWGSSYEDVLNKAKKKTLEVEAYVVVPFVSHENFTLVPGNNPAGYSKPARANAEALKVAHDKLTVYGAAEPAKVSVPLSSVEGTTGLENVALGDEYEPEYYNLQGIRIEHPVEGQVYLVRRGPVTAKEIFLKR